MSVEAIAWALNLAPVPADRAGRPSSPCRFVLVGLANHAGPDGTGAFPSVATLVRYTSLSERTVRTCLDRLAAEGIITPCVPDIIGARIKRADRRPQGWDLNLRLARGSPGEPAEAAAQPQPVHDGDLDGVQPLHPASCPVDNRSSEVQLLHPAAGTGCSERPGGVQSVPQRGAAAAPEPSMEPYLEPSAGRTRAYEASHPDHAAGGGAIGEFFADLGDAWLLSAEQRARLAPAVQAAIDTGWTPGALAAFTGANIDAVRSPYAVMTARLSASQLPPPPAQRGDYGLDIVYVQEAEPLGTGGGIRNAAPPRPPWCGECDERTRMLGFDGDAPAPARAASAAAKRRQDGRQPPTRPSRQTSQPD